MRCSLWHFPLVKEIRNLEVGISDLVHSSDSAQALVSLTFPYLNQF